MKFLKKLLATTALALLPSLGWAQNGITSTSTEVVPTLTSVAFNTTVKGDRDTSATVTIWYTTSARYAALGDAAFVEGMTFFRRTHYTQLDGSMHHGRILHALPGQEFKYKLVIVDAGGGGTSFAAATVQTTAALAIPTRPTSGPRIYVDDVTGSDSDDGSTPALAKKTITAGLAALKAQASEGANGAVVVYEGIYPENIVLDFPTVNDGASRAIIGVSRDSCIIDGSHVPVRNGSFAMTWSSTTSDSIYRAHCPMGDSISSVIIGWGEYLHKKLSMVELINSAMGEMSGWWWQNDTLYVQRRNGQSPQGSQIHLGYQKSGSALAGIRVARNGWQIVRMTVRFHGARPAQQGEAHGVQLGGAGGSNTSQNTVIDSCRFVANTGASAYHPVWGAGEVRNTNLWFIRSIIDGLTIGNMTYQSGKSRIDENSNIIRVIGQRTIVWNNYFTQCSNGPAYGNGGVVSFDSLSAYCNEMSNNKLYDFSDDGIELDSVDGINFLVMNNDVRRCLSALSTAPFYEGPIFVLYNRFFNFGFMGTEPSRGWKFGCNESTTDPAYLVMIHNTFFSKATAGWCRGSEHVGPTLRFKTLYFRNNVFFVHGGASGIGFDINAAADTASTYRNTLDYNGVKTVDGGVNRTFRVNSLYRPIVTGGGNIGVRTIPWETNGTQTPAFQDTTKNYITGVVAGGGLNAGLLIKGVNTDYRGARFAGGGPDLGAVESGWPGTGRFFIDRLRGLFR